MRVSKVTTLADEAASGTVHLQLRSASNRALAALQHRRIQQPRFLEATSERLKAVPPPGSHDLP